MCQDPPEDAEAYRNAKQVATSTFFDASASKEVRLKAAEGLGYPDKATFVRLLKLGANTAQDDAIRWEALRRHPWTPEWVMVVLEILADQENGGEKLNADLVQDLSRRTVKLSSAEVRQAIQKGLRSLLDDPRDSVRQRAYFALVSTQDPVATTKLVEGLENGGADSPVPLSQAIEMIDVAGATRHFNALRPYLRHPDPEVQVEAVRVLTADANSRPTIVKLIAEQETPEAVRVQGLRGMARLDERLSAYAIPLIRNPDEPIAVREAAMRAMVAQVNYKEVEASEQIRFAEAVEALASEPGLEAVGDDQPQKRANELLQYLQKSSPAIRQHYESKR